jgi:hypothetical protein
MSKTTATLWATAILAGSTWMAVHVLFRGVPGPTTGVEFFDHLLRVAWMAQEAWGVVLTVLGILGTGAVLAAGCFVPGLHGEGGYQDGFGEGDGCGDGD